MYEYIVIRIISFLLFFEYYCSFITTIPLGIEKNGTLKYGFEPKNSLCIGTSVVLTGEDIAHAYEVAIIFLTFYNISLVNSIIVRK